MQSVETVLQRLADSCAPGARSRELVRRAVARRIDAPQMLPLLERKLQPTVAVKARIRERVLMRIEAPRALPVFITIRSLIDPDSDVRSIVYHRVMDRLLSHRRKVSFLSPIKWTAAFAVFALLVRMSPFPFLAPTTRAGSDVMLLPTEGRVTVSIGGLWQEVPGEIVLEPGMRIRTDEGEASVVYHDDAVLRLGAHTVLALHDVSDSFDSAPEVVPTASLLEGTVWMQGLIAGPARGFTVAVPNGYVTVNEGSVSVTVNEGSVDVSVWDRRSTVSHNGKSVALIAGEKTDFRPESPLLVKKTHPDGFHADWQKQNLARDAVHRRHIAHLQQERRAAQAGILPTSTFYPVKRVAEEMDVLMTLSAEERIQKRLDQAHTRLNEAAAMLQEGGDEAVIDIALAQFKETLTALTADDGVSDAQSRFLVRQSIEQAYADLAASLPGDQSYLLKRVVIEATADLSDDLLDAVAVRDVLFTDALDRLTAAAESADTETLRSQWVAFQPYLSFLESDSTDPLLSAEVVKEAEIALQRVAVLLSQDDSIADIDPDFRQDLTAFLPPKIEDRIALSDEEVQGVVDGMIDRIYVYGMPRSRLNQLHVELGAIIGHEEEGRFLRLLYERLPSGSRLTEHVRKEIVRLKWEKAAEQIVVIEQPVETAEPIFTDI